MRCPTRSNLICFWLHFTKIFPVDCLSKELMNTGKHKVWCTSLPEQIKGMYVMERLSSSIATMNEFRQP
jgi:hypothetical protein